MTGCLVTRRNPNGISWPRGCTTRITWFLTPSHMHRDQQKYRTPGGHLEQGLHFATEQTQAPSHGTELVGNLPFRCYSRVGLSPSTWSSLVTLKTPETPLARIKAISLSALLSTTPKSVTLPC